MYEPRDQNKIAWTVTFNLIAFNFAYDSWNYLDIGGRSQWPSSLGVGL
jgi:hypothetical protein